MQLLTHLSTTYQLNKRSTSTLILILLLMFVGSSQAADDESTSQTTDEIVSEQAEPATSDEGPSTEDETLAQEAEFVTETLSPETEAIANQPDASREYDALLVGVPDEHDGVGADVGYVHYLRSTSTAGLNDFSRFWSKNTIGVPGSNTANDEFGRAVASGDFNGDGYGDAVISDNGFNNEGAITVIYGSANPTTSGAIRITENDIPFGSAVANDQFGHALASGDFNADGYDDLAVSIPNQGLVNKAQAGVVWILYGSSTGLRYQTIADAPKLITQDELNGNIAEIWDRFGWSLASGDFNLDGYSDLAVGVPYENVGSQADAGAVNIVYGSSAGISTSGSQYFTQGQFGRSSEAGDKFGWSLATGEFNITPGVGLDQSAEDLAIGVPYEHVGGVADAGYVEILFGTINVGLSASENVGFSEGELGVAGAVETNNYFGFSLAAGDFDGILGSDLAIGIPGQDSSLFSNAGAVNVLTRPTISGPLNSIILRQTTFTGVLEAHDFFGEHLSTGDFNGDGRYDLVVGVSSESIGNSTDAGAVNIYYGRQDGFTAGVQFLHQDSTNMPGVVESQDRFATTVAAVHHTPSAAFTSESCGTSVEPNQSISVFWNKDQAWFAFYEVDDDADFSSPIERGFSRVAGKTVNVEEEPLHVRIRLVDGLNDLSPWSTCVLNVDHVDPEPEPDFYVFVPIVTK